jgi:rhodanese-related sulfurtransferase
MSDDLQIEPQALQERLTRDTPPLLIDVREPWEHEICRLEGSLLILLGELPLRYQKLLEAEEVVLYCHHGIRSLDAAVWLRNQGVEDAKSLAGGIERWACEVDPSIPRY